MIDIDTIIQYGELPPENETGKIEYKLKISTNCKSRRETLQTQLRRRLSNGESINGVPEAIYFIGINDNGKLGNEKLKSINKSIENLKELVNLIKAKIKNIKIKKINKSYIAKIVIIGFNNTNKTDEYRVAFIGPSGVGKSTIIANLTYGINDLNGSARKCVLNYEHEKKTGITSSISQEISGIKNNCYMDYNYSSDKVWERLYTDSDKIINYIDLPGHKKYYKTRIFGILSYKPHYIIITISPDIKDLSFYKKFIKIAQINKIKIICILNKIDILNENNKDIKKKIDELHIFDKIFNISCKNSEGIDELKKYLININFNKNNINNINNTFNKKFIITNVIKNHNVGTILTGIMNEGKLNIGDKLYIGSIKPNNIIENVKIKSIHKKLLPSQYIDTDNSGSIVLDEFITGINKNCVLVSNNLLDNFTNKITIKLNNFENIKLNTHFIIFTENVIENVIVKKIKEINNKQIIYLEFLKKKNINYISINKTAVLKNNKTCLICTII